MRILLIVLDGLGVGNAPDASEYNDHGADTLGHLFLKTPGLELPTLFSLGLGEIMRGRVFDPPARKCEGSYGRMRERSAGKDTSTGHWEMAGVITTDPFTTFEHFPQVLVEAISKEAGVEFLGNYPRGGTVILNELGEEHVRTGKPILYLSLIHS